MPEITCVGTGEAFDPDLPNTSILYEGERRLLLDCGYAVPRAFWNLTRDPELLDGIYISHIHADHAFGLPALLLWMRELGRVRPIEVIGGPGIGNWLTKLLELAYPGSSAREGCAISPRELAPGEVLNWGGLGLRNAQSAHSVRNLSLRIEEQGFVTCYSGDGAPTAATRALYANAHLVVHECYSLEPSSESHANLTELLAMAEALEISTLVVLHRSRDEKERVRMGVSGFSGPTRVLCPEVGDRIAVEAKLASPGGPPLIATRGEQS